LPHAKALLAGKREEGGVVKQCEDEVRKTGRWAKGVMGSHCEAHRQVRSNEAILLEVDLGSWVLD